MSDLVWIPTCDLKSVERELSHCATQPSCVLDDVRTGINGLTSRYNIICVDMLSSPAEPYPPPPPPPTSKGEGLYITLLVATTKTAADTPRLSLLFLSRVCACACRRGSHCPRPLANQCLSPTLTPHLRPYHVGPASWCCYLVC